MLTHVFRPQRVRSAPTPWWSCPTPSGNAFCHLRPPSPSCGLGLLFLLSPGASSCVFTASQPVQGSMGSHPCASHSARHVPGWEDGRCWGPGESAREGRGRGGKRARSLLEESQLHHLTTVQRSNKLELQRGIECSRTDFFFKCLMTQENANDFMLSK